jgi:hypothetical protein
MSEHRRSAARKVIPLPVRDEEESWPPALMEKMQERMELLGHLIELNRPPSRVDVYALHSAQKKIFELMTLYWAGLPPGKAKAALEGVAPKWARLNELMESNREKAQLLAKEQRLRKAS